MARFVGFLILGTSVWVLQDSQAIGVRKGQVRGLADMGPWGWFWTCLLMWMIAFPLYLAKRGEFKRINS
jgi:hypothetical protein